MKATKVDGVYDSEPVKNPDAKRFDRISYMDVLSKGLNVMDSTAFTLCMDNHKPIIVFDLTVEGNIARALKGEDVGNHRRVVTSSARRPGRDGRSRERNRNDRRDHA